MLGRPTPRPDPDLIRSISNWATTFNSYTSIVYTLGSTTYLPGMPVYQEIFLGMANLPTKVVDFGGSDSSRILILRGGILMSIGDSPEILSQRVLAGRILVGRLAVAAPPEITTAICYYQQTIYIYIYMFILLLLLLLL